MFVPAPLDNWYPDQRTTPKPTERLQAGDVVALWGHPLRVDHVGDEVPTDQWSAEFVEPWQQEGMPDAATWPSRPLPVVGHWDGPNADPDGVGVMASACRTWAVLPEHYSVCNQCLEIPPCRHTYYEEEVATAVARLTRDLELLPGICHACREPITDRQKSVVFPGLNLIRPDLPEGTAAFHVRARCSSGRRAYERRVGESAAETGHSSRPSGAPDRLF